MKRCMHIVTQDVVGTHVVGTTHLHNSAARAHKNGGGGGGGGGGRVCITALTSLAVVQAEC